VPTGGIERMNRFQPDLIAFESATQRQKLLHAETRRAHNETIAVRRMCLHAIPVGLLAGFIRLILFLIRALDRPVRGDLGIGPDPYQLVYDPMMGEPG
jgi:hypothetical protein